MDKGEAGEVEEEKSKDGSHGLLQALVRNMDFIIVEKRCQVVLWAFKPSVLNTHTKTVRSTCLAGF